MVEEIDTDDNGRVTLDEVIERVIAASSFLNSSLHEADQDNDGKISLSEFINATAALAGGPCRGLVKH